MDDASLKRSKRLEGKQTVNYADDLKEKRFVTVERAAANPKAGQRSKRKHQAAPVGRRTIASVSTNSRGGWEYWMGTAQHSAAMAAEEAAEALVERIVEEGGYAGMKVMSESQVRGGFWSQAPHELGRKLPNAHTKHNIYLKLVYDTAADEDGAKSKTSGPLKFKPKQREFKRAAQWAYAKDCNDAKWEVVWLPRDSGHGLSGGWAGCAKDLKLYPLDVVVFEGNASNADIVNIYVLRAYSYDPTFVLKTADDLPSLSEEGAEEGEEEAVTAEEEEVDPDEDANQDSELAGAAAAAQQHDSGVEVMWEDEDADAEAERAAARTCRAAKRARVGASSTTHVAATTRRGRRASLSTAAAARTCGTGSRRARRAGSLRPTAHLELEAADSEEEADEQHGEEEEDDNADSDEALAVGEIEKDVYYVHHIRGYKPQWPGREELFLVRWWYWKEMNYPDTWEPRSCLNDDASSYKWAVKPPRKYQAAKHCPGLF